VSESRQHAGRPAGHGWVPRTAEGLTPGQTPSTGKFGRLLPNLDPFHASDKALVALAGQMLESKGADQGAGTDNPSIPVAYIYLGQFIDHNITFDATTIEEVRVDPASVTNYRSPRFDLDSMYGSGPAVQPHLYQRDDPDLFEIGVAQVFTKNSDGLVSDIGIPADLPRAYNRFALIADPRNDENLIVAQLHLAFLFFHNRIVEWLRTGGAHSKSPLQDTVFTEARELAIRHYQWTILHDFLPRLVGRRLIDDLMRSPCIMTRMGRLFMPVEFSAAAYRFGHSALRPQYNINGIIPSPTLQGLFNFSGRNGSIAKVPVMKAWVVEWYRLLHMDPALPDTLSRRIDPYLTDDLATIPIPGGTQSLPAMNLRRGNMMGLPSGQSVARFFEQQPLTPDEIATGPDGAVARKHGLDRNTPLWYYILKEALIKKHGTMLGPAGARIVAEAFIGLLQLDENSILNRARDWKPTLPRENRDDFTLTDLLRFAGVMKPKGAGFGPSLLKPVGRQVMPACYSTPAAS
jgi:hypothetical protein